MGTYGDMITRIEDEIADSTLNTQVRRSIISAIEFHESQRWWFNETQVTWTASVRQEYYTLSDVTSLTKLPVDVDSVKYVNSRTSLSTTAGAIVDGESYLLKQRDWSWMEKVARPNTQGDPVSWCWYKRTIRVYPTAHSLSATHKPIFVLSAIIPPSSISVSMDLTTSNAWFNEAERLIRYRSKAILYAEVRREMDEASKFSSMAEAEYRKLRYDHANYTAKGNMTGSNF